MEANTSRCRCRAVVLAVCLVGTLGLGPAAASAWVSVPDVQTVGVNPCTGVAGALLLHDVQLLISGNGGDQEGFKFKGRFTTGDGVSGIFHDQDQWNAVPRGGDEVFTRVVLFRGVDEAKQRVVFTAVFHIVVRDGSTVQEVLIEDARCVGVGSPPG